MTDPNRAPRRVSMAYILGFTNKPFKDGGPPALAQLPPPRRPGHFQQMVRPRNTLLKIVVLTPRRSPRLEVSLNGLLAMVAAAGSPVLVSHD